MTRDEDCSISGDTSNHPDVTMDDTPEGQYSTSYRISCANSSGKVTAASVRRCMQLGRIEDCVGIKDCTPVPFYRQRFSCDGWKDVARDTADCPAGVKCSLAHHSVLPGKDGTFPVTNGWWLCGHTVYVVLPPDWTGVCAPVTISDHTIIISEATKTRFSRDLEFKPHDPVWGSDVPKEFKHRSAGAKIILSLFPGLGVAKNMLRLETIDYRLKSFLNYTLAAFTGITEELTGLRLMVMQNRMVLDQLTAPQGGVCAIIGKYCCTFIPENDADGHIIAQAIQNITKIQAAMVKDGIPSPDWLTGLWYTWKGILIQVAIILCAFFVFVLCVIPLLRNMISRLFTRQMTMYCRMSTNDQQLDQLPITDFADDLDDDTDSFDDLDVQV